MLRPRFYLHYCTSITLLSWLPCYANESPSGAEEQWAQVEKEVEAVFDNHQGAQNTSWDESRRRVLQKWSDGALPERKIYVEYFDQDTTRVKVDYDNGSVTVESLIDSQDQPLTTNQAAEAKDRIQKALSSVIAKNSNSPVAIISTDEITNIDTGPKELATLLSRSVESVGSTHGMDRKERRLYRTSFKLVPNYVKLRAAKFKPFVERWAKKYRIDPAFVMAIMRQESAFNPRARSPVGAIGLMQIMPQFAGQEVMAVVTGTPTIPTSEYLYDPQKNIMVGATYIQLLRDRYFPDIKDEEKLRYFIICSYNWGPQRIKMALSKGRLTAQVSADDLFVKLQQIAPAETKEYLKKVTQYAAEFKGKD